jgi:hypothetical protein
MWCRNENVVSSHVSFKVSSMDIVSYCRNMKSYTLFPKTVKIGGHRNVGRPRSRWQDPFDDFRTCLQYRALEFGALKGVGRVKWIQKQEMHTTLNWEL